MSAQTISGLSQNDRLGVTVFGSFLVHMVIILGVVFNLPKFRDLPGLPTLEITLVQTTSDKRPDNPEFLAQANQDGGGDSDAPEVAKNPCRCARSVRLTATSRHFNPCRRNACRPNAK